MPSVHLSQRNFILWGIAIKMANQKNIKTMAIDMYKVKNDLVPETASKIFCPQTDSRILSVRSVYHGSESISYLSLYFLNR